jgi:hypothetical protein
LLREWSEEKVLMLFYRIRKRVILPETTSGGR